MRLPKQSAGVTRDVISTRFAGGNGQGIMPQLRFGTSFGTRLTDEQGCYFGCRANGGPDLFCRFSCGLRPVTIGGLLIAE